MDYQTKKLPTISEKEAIELIGKRFHDKVGKDYHDKNIVISLNYSCWPEVFGSTAGPFGGIGGATITTFTTEAWEIMGFAVIFCNGKIIRYVEGFSIIARWIGKDGK